MSEKRRPNILMILADQLTAKALPTFSISGKAIIPHIAELAAQGVVFQNAYCNSPLCAPSRASLATGLRISRNRVYGNGAEFKASIPTFMHYLRLSGYRTVLSGKAHFVGPDQLHGFEKRLTTDIYPADFLWSPDWSKEVPNGEGTSVQKLKISGICRTNNQILYDEEVQFRAKECLRKEALEPQDRPFFLSVSYTQPHESFQVTQEYWDLYKDIDIRLPETPAPNQHHPYNQWLQHHHGVDQYPPTKEEIIDSRRAYCGMISLIDHYVGELIEELKRFDLYENTIIIFTSDHGEMLGEHGMWYKRTFYEESVKVPLIVSWSEVWSHREVEEIVSLVDLCPTIAELGGYEGAAELQNLIEGDSLYPLLDGSGKDWKNEVIMEYLGGGVRSPMLMIRKENMKYIFVLDQEPLLFDLDQDPHELNNLTGQKEWVQKQRELHKAAVGELDLSGLKEEIIRNQKDRLLIHRAQQIGDPVSWDYQPFFDASRQYVRGKNLPLFY